MLNGAKEGKWVESMDSNENYNKGCKRCLLYSNKVYKAGKPAGVVHTYFKNRKIKTETAYTDGKKERTGENIFCKW